MLCGLGVVSLLAGFSGSWALRLLEGIAVFGLGAAIVGGAAVLVMIRLAGWRDPQSEEDFDKIVERAERLAARQGPEDAPRRPEDAWEGPEDAWEEADEGGNGMFDSAISEEDFRALVRSAIDELPIEFHRALEHVAIVVSDGGRHQRAYGLYQGDTVARDHFHDRIVIFRDTLVRDFGHDPDLLKAQVVRVVRHELAHHLGWDEPGVRGLGL